MSKTAYSLVIAAIASLGLAACAAPAAGVAPAGGMRMGAMGGMMERHNAPIPAEYASATNAVGPDAASLVRGEIVYSANCASCHGDGGLGDGPAAVGLNPAPASIAHTSQMMSDAYLFWRVSEGGVPFRTAMPAWKGVLDERARWDAINYVRALGQGAVTPKRAVGGATGNAAEAEARMMADMVAQAVKDGVITQADADVFNQVHPIVDAYAHAMPRAGTGDPLQRQTQLVSELTAAGTLTQAQGDRFLDIVRRLQAAGRL